jgi:predicted metal-dependent hydrolase
MTPASYEIRVSPRAKHPRLKMSARDGLVVVIPDGFDEARIPEIVGSKRDWIRRTEERFQVEAKFLVPHPPAASPERITLRVIGEEWGVDYRATNTSSVTVGERPGNQLLVFGDVENQAATREALRRWLSRKTHQHIAPWVRRLAHDHGFDVSKIVVKSQRTRWASCSAKKTISLNLLLMFLPEPVVRYAILHELAHTREMNHGPRYWAVVNGIAPGYEVLDEELRRSWRLVPEWIRPTALRPTPTLDH